MIFFLAFLLASIERTFTKAALRVNCNSTTRHNQCACLYFVLLFIHIDTRCRCINHDDWKLTLAELCLCDLVSGFIVFSCDFFCKSCVTLYEEKIACDTSGCAQSLKTFDLAHLPLFVCCVYINLDGWNRSSLSLYFCRACVYRPSTTISI